ncbi:hypothetical protein BD779DRAFT_1571794 [Infundibulicybe gibba]|nr:hypothetical protein BD779DRAFT_1571794 [Infundibulicybe gibba]
MHNEPPESRPSLHHATATIDDLTIALANFSRVPSPEPPSLSICCCDREECQHTKDWLNLKSRLESRLILSAEVGQALLQRHEAYVRRHEGRDAQDDSTGPASFQDQLDLQFAELMKEKALLERRLNQAIVNNEVTEVSNKTILQELQDARSTISRLTAQHARSVGWDTRLSAAMKEREDMQQERDSEAQKARLAESRFAALKDKTAKLQTEVRRLQEELEIKRHHRLESSESLLQDARTQLENLNRAQLGHNLMAEHLEITKVLESLVNDNEALKHDNAELQHLLAESRDDLHALQEEVDEQRASRSGVETPLSRQNFYPGSVPPTLLRDPSVRNSFCPNLSMIRSPRLAFEPLTPETNRRPLSPADSLDRPETKSAVFSQPQPRYPPSQISFDIDEGTDGGSYEAPEKPGPHKSLFLSTRSRGVQTDSWPGLLSPSPLPSHISTPSPHDPRSESSSFSDSPPSNLTSLLERAASLFSRLTQTDPFTLTNRLKRQHLKGADVGHLSRTTVSSILSESTNLRVQFRPLLEDDKITTCCTRKDFRLLFKLLREIFTEMGNMRVTLNDIILDPSIASRISEQSLDPSKVEARERARAKDGPLSHGAGWMAPISKFFGSPTHEEDSSAEHAALVRSEIARGPTRHPPRAIPKLGPALAASATTVNVEFSGTGVGRSVTSTFSARPSRETTTEILTPQGVSPGVMDIFAGAPRNSSGSSEPWVVVPKGPRRMQSLLSQTNTLAPPSVRRPLVEESNSGPSNRLSRHVDAVIDVDGPLQDGEEPDYVAPLLERTLRRRGLSDSSIHSTFTGQATGAAPLVPGAPTGDAVSPRGAAWPERSSVLRAFSKKVQNFRLTGSNSIPLPAAANNASQIIGAGIPRVTVTSTPGLGHLLPNISSWAAAGTMIDPITGAEPFLAGSVREESFLSRTRRPGESHHRDFF